jgi:hypothetical protein
MNTRSNEAAERVHRLLTFVPTLGRLAVRAIRTSSATSRASSTTRDVVVIHGSCFSGVGRRPLLALADDGDARMALAVALAFA